jgi:hypothetical protein
MHPCQGRRPSAPAAGIPIPLGDQAVQELKRRFRREVATGNGLDCRGQLAERDQRHKRTAIRVTRWSPISEGKGPPPLIDRQHLYQVDEVSAWWSAGC